MNKTVNAEKTCIQVLISEVHLEMKQYSENNKSTFKISSTWIDMPLLAARDTDNLTDINGLWTEVQVPP